MFRTTISLLTSALALGLAACAAGPEADQADAAPAAAGPAVLVDDDALAQSRVLVDLRQAVRVVFGAPAAALPLDRVDLIAPDGTTAVLDA